MSNKSNLLMRFVVTGGSGFIGSNIVKWLLGKEHEVDVYGSKSYESSFRLKHVLDKKNYKIVNLDDLETLKENLKNIDVVIHFAGSANTSIGLQKTDVDLKKGIIYTYNVLETMKTNGIKKIIFPSGPAVYGYPKKIPTREDTGMLFPVSLYGAAKLACEGMISAYCHLFGIQSWIFRLGNVVGPGMTSGVIFDFINKLKQNPNELSILGDGQQKKDVIFIDDCIDGIFFAFQNSNDVLNVFNLSSGTTISVNDIAKIIQNKMKIKNCKFTYTGGEVGWLGDVPVVHYDTTKIRKLGWKPKYGSDEAVRITVKDALKDIK